jgi:membrane protease YdiL (CAAX protease family)
MGDARPGGLPQPRSDDPPRVGPARTLVAEVLGVWIVTLLLIRGVVQVQEGLGLHEIIRVLVPILFMYAPVVVLRWRGVDPDDYPLALPPLRDPVWRDALRLNAVLIGIIIMPWLVGYHVWQTMVFHHHFKGIWPTPSGFASLIGYHLFFAAIPEELFYRGYVQSRLDEAFGRPWRILGADLGPGWLITCVVFAAGHSIVQVQWWHFAIVFPSLAFGWMRARTRHIVAGALFHAWCNITVGTLDTLYGIVAP